MTSRGPIDRDVRIGHVHLKVADLTRSLDFYEGVLGFEVTQKYGSKRPFCRQAGIITTSLSTPGRAWRRAASAGNDRAVSPRHPVSDSVALAEPYAA